MLFQTPSNFDDEFIVYLTNDKPHIPKVFVCDSQHELYEVLPVYLASTHAFVTVMLTAQTHREGSTVMGQKKGSQHRFRAIITSAFNQEGRSQMSQ